MGGPGGRWSIARAAVLVTGLTAVSTLLASLVQAHGRFAWSSLQGVPFNLVMIAAAGMLGPRTGISALAVGYAVGSAARLLMQVPPCGRSAS